jgi:ribosomal protein L39E
MVRKSTNRKMMLGHKLKQSRRMPLLAMLRTHRRLSQNKFRREWRSKKIKKTD